ncbi:MAG: class I SAM-dependent methyltransferase [Candidatus Aenigmarchaeota archaeon]|nr:class I SAM-dependent methyltransferase [Candidatus Aenigmarchaeota archaeon]
MNEELSMKGRFSFKSHAKEDELWNRGDEILDVLRVAKDDRILDAGCGSYGKIIVPAAKRGIKITGLDISPTAIKLLRTRLKKMQIGKRCKLVVGDINSLPFKDSSFDKVVCIATFLHLSSLGNSINELSRVTKKGGFLYLATFKNNKAAINLFYQTIMKLGFKTMRVYFYSFENIVKNFELNDLKVIKVWSTVGFLPFYMNLGYSKIFRNKFSYKKIEGFDPSAHTWSFLLKKL